MKTFNCLKKFTGQILHISWAFLISSFFPNLGHAILLWESVSLKLISKNCFLLLTSLCKTGILIPIKAVWKCSFYHRSIKKRDLSAINSDFFSPTLSHFYHLLRELIPVCQSLCPHFCHASWWPGNIRSQLRLFHQVVAVPQMPACQNLKLKLFFFLNGKTHIELLRFEILTLV